VRRRLRAEKTSIGLCATAACEPTGPARGHNDVGKKWVSAAAWADWAGFKGEFKMDFDFQT
jgi:hypothetical protein